jgi:FixJ family two-component response regulator
VPSVFVLALVLFTDVASCLVLDIRLPGISGLDFQRELVQAKNGIPIIFITAHGDFPPGELVLLLATRRITQRSLCLGH